MPEHECEVCGRSFDTKRGLSVHESQSHSSNSAENDDKQNVEDADDDKRTVNLSLSVNQALIIVFILGIGIGFLAGAISPVRFSDTAASQSGQQDSGNSRVQITSDMLENEPALGSSDAPLTIVEYSDYGCPWCAEWAGFEAIPDDATRVTGTIDNKETLQKIKENYVDTGDARFVFKDYPVKSLHPNAPSAHKAANCILEQDESLYWKFHDKLFEKREQWKQSNQPLQEYKSFADSVGANVSEFTSCYQSSDNSEVQKDKRQIGSLTGRLGTPAIFIGNTDDGFVMIQGAQPYSSLKNVIDTELEKARK